MNNDSQISYLGEAYPGSSNAIIMVHGRGSNGSDIVHSLRDQLLIEDFYILAPAAVGNTWYPYSFLAPRQQNEPSLGNSLNLLGNLLNALLETGYKSTDIYLLGFSQGACLVLEFSTNTPKRLSGIFAFSVGLICDHLRKLNYEGDFKGSPIFLGCSDIDPHIPLPTVKESSRILTLMGSSVPE